MKIILLLLVVPLLAIMIIKLSKFTKIPAMLLFIFIGLLFGTTGVINLFDNDFIKEPLAWFTTNIALIIMFLWLDLV